MTEQRRLAAIVSTDVAGYSRLMGRDESGTLAALKAVRQEVVDPAIGRHGGRIVKTTGDGLLLEFPSVVNAVRCAVEVQTAMASRAAGIADDRRIAFRIGINLGDIIVEGDDIFGDGVNVAARLQEIAPPGGICISNRVHEDVRDRLDTFFDDGGSQTLKNIARPVHVWRWQPSRAMSTKPALVSASLPLPDKPSIAVLPFENMSGDPQQEYFVDGLVEEIITALSRFKSLFVIARNSSFTYKGKAVDIKQVGRELGVRYVLEGSARKAANKVRITGQLIEGETAVHIWADRYDGDLSEIFELQDRVAIDVVGAITPKLEQAEIERAGRKPTENLGAYDYYLRGMAAYYTRKSEGPSNARQFFSRAIELDPGFAAAYAMTAYCNAMMVGAAGVKSDETLLAETSQLMSRAVELDRNDATVLARVAFGHARLGLDLRMAASYSERARTLNPNLALAWAVSGWVKVWLGEPEIAIEHFSRAVRLTPLSADALLGLVGKAHAYLMDECYSEAWSTAAMAAQELESATAYRIAAASAAMAGHQDEAADYVALLLRHDPDRRVSNLTDVLGPYNRSEDVERYKKGLRLAGLPE